MKISFLLLAHEHPEKIRPLINCLLVSGSNIFLHYDKNTPHNIEKHIASWNTDSLPGKIFIVQRSCIKWGEWSIVQATLNCLDSAIKNDNSDYFMLISGSCMPVKPIVQLRSVLESSKKDYIETVNATIKRWVTGGIQKKRWELYHFFNWRLHPRCFSLSLKLQKIIKIKRTLPANHVPHIGSQWWCLRKSTIIKIMDFIKKNPSALTFYRRTCIPDEHFFQTIVANLVPASEIVPTPLTKYSFNSWGIPRVYYEDEYAELLLTAKEYFVRKISHRAKKLKEKLSAVATMSPIDFKSHLSEITKVNEKAVRYKCRIQDIIKKNSWYNICSSHENIYDYVQSIPNKIVLIVSEDENIRKACGYIFSKYTDVIVAPDLLVSPHSRTIANKSSGGLNSKNDFNQNEIRYQWHLTVGQLAFRNPGKKVVITAGNEFLKVIEFFQLKSNCNLILVTDPDTDINPLLHSQILKNLKKSKNHIIQCSVETIKNILLPSATFFTNTSTVPINNLMNQNVISN